MEDQQYYRIEVQPSSQYPPVINFILLAAFCWALYQWQYYMPEAVKPYLFFWAVALYGYWFTQFKRFPKNGERIRILHLSEFGAFKAVLAHSCTTSGKLESIRIEGHLTSCSYTLPFACYLCLKQEFNPTKQFFTVYKDQCSEEDFARLRRIVIAKKNS